MTAWLARAALLLLLASAIGARAQTGAAAPDPKMQAAAEAAPAALQQDQASQPPQTPVLRLGVEKDWPPIEFINDKGEYSGVISSTMRSIEKKLGIRFEIVKKDSFSEVLAAFGRGEIDVISALGKTEAREKTMHFTQPYITFTDGLIVRNDEPYVEHLKDFAAGKRLAMVEGYGSNERAAANHPQLVAVPMRTAEEALFAVSTGRADIAIASLASAYYLTQNKGLTNLRVAANYDEFEQNMAMAVRPGLEAYVPLFNQALADITAVEHAAMREQWTRVPVDRGVARSVVLYWTVAALLVLALMALWVGWLLSQQRRRAALLARAEEAEAQFRALLDAVPAVFWMMRTQAGRPAQIIHLSPKPLMFGGVSVMPGEQSFDEATILMPREDRERLQHLLERHGKTMTGFTMEHRMLHSGRTTWVLLQVTPRREKVSTTWYGCSIDISQRKMLESELERSRNQLEELAAGVPGALWQFRREPDGQQQYSYMSNGIIGITGRTPDETNALMKDKSFVSVHPDDLHILQGLMQRLTERPGIDGARYRLRVADGGWIWVQVAARAMPIGPDGTRVWNGITLDATELHETEQALRYERQRLQELADSFAGALWRLRRRADGSFQFEYVSEGVFAIAGRTAAEIMDQTRQPLTEIIDEDRPKVLAALNASAESGRPFELEYSTHAAHGGIERLFARATVRIDDGEAVWTGVLLNVSERYRLSTALAEARDRLEDIAANFPGAIFQLLKEAGGGTRYTYVSEGITALTGRPPRTRDGREQLTDLTSIHADDRALVLAATDAMIEAGGSSQFDYRLINAAGQPRWVHCAITARRQSDGSTLLNGLLLDAEESKRLETELRAATGRAEAASQAKSRFLANMSHEIRTPMNAVIGLAHIAMTSEVNPVQAERIAKIHRAGKALLKLLNDILEYSRLDAGKFKPVPVAFDLAEINENLRLFSLPAAEAKGLGFRIECDADVPMHWVGDATRIQQILLNLITNAIKFTDSGSVTLAVTSRCEAAPCLCFEVRDTGIGMTEEQTRRVFDAFEQASGDIERRHGGSGLGLSICRELVAALGGRIEVQSQPGAGTSFKVMLPLLAGEPPQRPLAGADLLPRLAKLATHIGNRETTSARVSAQALRLLLAAEGRDREIHVLERLLASYDFDAAATELARLRASWGLSGNRLGKTLS